MNWILLILKFLNDNLGVITLLVGLFALFIYKRQKEDRKRDAARLILQEIRYAEQKVRNYKDFLRYNLFDQLLTTNSWNDNIHMFVTELKETEIDLISNFYAKASYIDLLIRKISDFKTQPKTPIVLQTNPITQPQMPGTGQVINNQQMIFFDPMEEVQKILKDVADKFEFIYNTPTLDKLRKISEKKWYQLL